MENKKIDKVELLDQIIRKAIAENESLKNKKYVGIEFEPGIALYNEQYAKDIALQCANDNMASLAKLAVQCEREFYREYLKDIVDIDATNNYIIKALMKVFIERVVQIVKESVDEHNEKQS